MEKYVYIKRSIPGKFIDFAEPLNSVEYDNIGNTYNDYLSNLWVLLTDEQVEFHMEHPNASVKEVYNMQLDPVDDLAKAKYLKIREIVEYDSSPNVNSFTLNGNEMWLTAPDRQQLATQIEVNESIGRDSMTKWFGGVGYTFTILEWKQMLTSLEVYAGDALNVTEMHKAAVNAMTTIEDVRSYDITFGYPTKLEF